MRRRSSRWLVALVLVALVAFHLWQRPDALVVFRLEGSPDVRFQGRAELRLGDEVAAFRHMEAKCLPHSDLDAPGKCGFVTPVWDNVAPGTYEEWWRLCWYTSLAREPLCTVYVPEGCNVMGCKAEILIPSGVQLSESCIRLLAACGTLKDGAGYWYIGERVILGSTHLPIILKGK